MHKQNLRFMFEGSVYDNLGRCLIGKCLYYTQCQSAKKAISNINFIAKKECGLSRDSFVALCGKLSCENILTYTVENNKVQYQAESTIEEYTVIQADGTLKLNSARASLPYYADLFKFFSTDKFSREQFLCKINQLTVAAATLCKRSKENEQSSVCNYAEFSRVDDITLEDEDAIWIWDEEEGVYWKNGEKFGDYLVSLED